MGRPDDAQPASADPPPDPPSGPQSDAHGGRDGARLDPWAAGGADGLGAWVGRMLVADAARQRSDGYWLRRQAEEEGTFSGVLADLAERTTPVVVQLRNGRRHRGTVTALGADFAVLRTGERDVLVRLDAIDAIRTLPRERATIGDRPAAGTLTFGEALAAMTGERPRLLLVGQDPGDPVCGELRAVGRDVLHVRVDGGGAAYVALASVTEVSAAESG